jgi:hypothetical protein
MRIGRLNYKKNIGLVLILAGITLFLLPFCLVAIGNLLETTKPADAVINNFGIVIITAGPVLIIAGLAFILIKVIKRLTRL